MNLIFHDKCRPKVINDNPVTQFNPSSQTNHHKPDDSREANDFFGIIEQYGHSPDIVKVSLMDVEQTSCTVEKNHQLVAGILVAERCIKFSSSPSAGCAMNRRRSTQKLADSIGLACQSICEEI
jgi:hypothetical protein